MTLYLLDTNILSNLFRNPDGIVEETLRKRHREEIGTSIIVKGEIEFGLRKNRNLRGARQFQDLIEVLTVWPLDRPAETHYANLRGDLEERGISAGANDLWIAAQALALDAVLVSDDRVFGRMPNLKIENWLRA